MNKRNVACLDAKEDIKIKKPKILRNTLFFSLFFTLLLVNVVCAKTVSLTLNYDGKNHQYSAEEISLFVDGNKLTTLQVPPVIINSRTYVPAREVFEPLGAVVDWKANSKEVYIGYKDDLVVLKVDNAVANLNGVSFGMESAPKIINNKTMIPVRFAAESLDIPVNWIAASREVYIGEYEEPDNNSKNAQIEDVSNNNDNTQTTQNQQQVQTQNYSQDVSTSNITAIQYPETTVTSVSMPSTTNNIFSINATSQISKVEKLLMPEGKLVIDIHNAATTMGSTTINDTGLLSISAVRTSQFQLEPVKIARVVFDLTSNVKYSVSISDDRKSVQIQFQESSTNNISFSNSINNISFSTNGDSDFITVTGTSAPVPSTTKTYANGSIIIDFDNAQRNLSSPVIYETGVFVNRISTTQEANSVRMTINVKTKPVQSVSYNANSTIIELKNASFKNISYSNADNSRITLKKAGSGLNKNSIMKRDEYVTRDYYLTLPGNYSNTYGYGEFEIYDDNIKTITIGQNSSSNTEIYINESKINECVITEDNENIYIDILDPREVYSQIIYLDAGHGGSGSTGASGNGVVEKVVNLDIVQRLYSLLDSDPNFKVYASRLDDSYPQTADRAYMANESSDLFISIHHNSFNSTANGTETLYHNHENEQEPNITSKKVAQIIQSNLVKAVGTSDRGIVHRPDLIVLNTTNVPAVLVEVAFVSNAADAEKIKSEQFRQNVANSLYSSIKEIFVQFPTGR